MVAEDVAVGGYICNECIDVAITAEMMIIAAWKNMNVRHPKLDEFNGWDDH